MELSQPLRALLIGIDHYPEGGCLADGGWYPDLHGSVRDIERMECYLRLELGVARERIQRLTAPIPGAAPWVQPPAGELPTYENIVASFQSLIRRSRPGEQVLIHYSGHGGRIPTLAPAVKTNGLDEALVPTDIADPGARYLRDLEIAHLLREMVEHELFVTLVLDCCHSGGATRHGVQVRGGSAIDRTLRPRESLVATLPVMSGHWKKLLESTPRDVTVGSGWLPDPRGYVLLAACRAQELAYEYVVSRVGQVGALSHGLLEGLRAMGPSGTYRQLYHRIEAQVRSRYEMQTPQIEGDLDRLLFEPSFVARPRHAVNVLRSECGRLLLNTGEAQGVGVGARFDVYGPQWSGWKSDEDRLAEVEVTAVGAVDSWAHVAGGKPHPSISPGAQAIPVSDGRASVPDSLRELRNEDVDSPLVGCLMVALIRLPADYHPAEPPRPAPDAALFKRLEVEVGEWLCLKIENLAQQAFNVTVLDMRPAGSVTQVFPLHSGGSYYVLDSEQDVMLPMRADLPSGCDFGVDVLKVVATLEAVDFRWLERPTAKPIRSLEPSAYPGRDWIAEQVEVAVSRSF